MPSTIRAATVATTAAYAFVLFTILSVIAMAHAAPSLGEMDNGLLEKRASAYDGCYSSSTPLKSQGVWMYQSAGYCEGECNGAAVYAMSDKNTCWCGDQLPAEDDKVDDSKCDLPCTGFPGDTCGGDGFYSVFLSGTKSDVSNYGGSSKSSSSSSSKGSSTTDAVVVTSTNAGQTVVVTVPANADAAATDKSSSGGGGTNTAGIAAGVVVGVVAIAGIILGIYFFIRHKRRREAEEDFKQRTQVDNFMRGAGERKPPGTAYSGMSDQRLDPEAGRRNSVGSLADNQDYSRRILRVANPSD